MLLNSLKLYGYKSTSDETVYPRANINHRSIRIENAENEPISVHFHGFDRPRVLNMSSKSSIPIAIPTQGSGHYLITILKDGKVVSETFPLKNTSNYVVLRKTLIGWMATYFSIPVIKAS